MSNMREILNKLTLLESHDSDFHWKWILKIPEYHKCIEGRYNEMRGYFEADGYHVLDQEICYDELTMWIEERPDKDSSRIHYPWTNEGWVNFPEWMADSGLDDYLSFDYKILFDKSNLKIGKDFIIKSLLTWIKNYAEGSNSIKPEVLIPIVTSLKDMVNWPELDIILNSLNNIH